MKLYWSKYSNPVGYIADEGVYFSDDLVKGANIKIRFILIPGPEESTLTIDIVSDFYHDEVINHTSNSIYSKIYPGYYHVDTEKTLSIIEDEFLRKEDLD